MVKWIGALLAASMLAPVAAEAQLEAQAQVDVNARGPRGDAGGERRTRERYGDRAERAPRLEAWQDRPRADDAARRRDERGSRGIEGAPIGERPAPPPPMATPDGERQDRRYTARRDDGIRRDDARWDGRQADPERRRFEAGERDRRDRVQGDRSRPNGDWRDAGRGDERWRDRERRDDRDWRRRDARDWNGGRDWNAGQNWGDSRGTWSGGSRWDRDGRGGGNRWDRGWRAQQQYDWSRYRSVNRNAFRLPRYYAPYGWTGGYRRFSVGIGLSDGLWDRNYWIADPFAYRLPEVYGPYRWVRYYDDALLVDIRSGIVVDAVYDIFW